MGMARYLGPPCPPCARLHGLHRATGLWLYVFFQKVPCVGQLNWRRSVIALKSRLSSRFVCCSRRDRVSGAAPADSPAVGSGFGSVTHNVETPRSSNSLWSSSESDGGASTMQ